LLKLILLVLYALHCASQPLLLLGYMACLTLLSDLGLQDASVAAAKGILSQYLPDVAIIDIAHEVEPFHLQQAAYLLSAAYPYFPEKTCHIVICDIFSGSPPEMLLCEKDNYYFLAPDNGILSLTLGTNLDSVWKCFEIKANHTLKDWLHEAGKVSKMLQSASANQLGLQPHDLKNAPRHLQPKLDGNVVECHVIHIDRFENVVINITKKQFDAIGRNRPFTIQLIREDTITELSRNYNDVKEGEKLCRFNTAGYLEISINKGKAASLLGLKLYREQHLIYNTIKISFQ
jgi:S-adenosylmethionine hydrolase